MKLIAQLYFMFLKLDHKILEIWNKLLSDSTSLIVLNFFMVQAKVSSVPQDSIVY